MKSLPLFPSLRSRSHLPELMDMADSDPLLLERTLSQFAFINCFLTRSRHLLRTCFMKRMLQEPAREYHMLDLGAGACETAVWFLDHCRRRGLRLRITACDHDPRVVEYARSRYAEVEGLRICERGIYDLHDLAPFDFVFSNHLLHHLSDEQIVELISHLAEFPQAEVVMNDLHRSRLAYSAYRIISPLLLRRSFARYDGLLSIMKGFRKEELRKLAEQAASPSAADCRVFYMPPARTVLYRPLQRAL